MCDRSDEILYDLEMKHGKAQKEEIDLNKRVNDIKGKTLKMSLI